MASRPRIGLTLELTDPIVNEVEARMREVIEGAGGRVLVIPHSADPDAHRELYPLLDGVVMMGGPDVEPERYGAERHALSEPGHAGMDVTDIGLAEACLADGKPVLGICRGSQVLNVAAGGSLIQDVPSHVGDGVGHMLEWRSVLETPPACRHEVRIEPTSRLASWLGSDALVVNSYHHQAVDRVGDGLRAVAWAPDGVIEATESTNGAFALGLQWHNEFHMRADERFARPLVELVRAAVARA